MAIERLFLSSADGDGLDRRVFIQGVGWVSLSLLLATAFGGCEACVEQIANRPTRRRLRTGSAEVDAAIATYSDAVAQMKALPGTDPRSWAAQAAIHGTEVPNVFIHCEHGTDHFFSWHRAYLLYFERICQELTGDDTFGLPYWNWNQNPDMHAEFTTAGSPLDHSPRSNTSMAGVWDVTGAALDPIFGDPNFYTFSSQIEGTPHNQTHVTIGGTMVTGGSPLDPIFWAHHCMVDYCWAKWNLELGNDNTNDQAWIDTSWNHFVDADGNPVEVTAGATILMPLFSYQYEESAIGSFAGAMARAIRDFDRLEARLRAGADVHLDIRQRFRIAERATVGLTRPFSAELATTPAELATVIDSDRADERIFASVDWAELPPTNDFFVRVFVNRPDADPTTGTDDPHFAGSFAFFGTGSAHGEDHGGKRSFLVNVTPTLRRLRSSGALLDGEPVSLQLVAVPAGRELAQPEAELTLQGVELLVAPASVGTK